MRIDAHDLTIGTKALRKVTMHREECPKWGKEFCLECFGGGLRNFLENLFKDETFVYQLRFYGLVKGRV